MGKCVRALGDALLERHWSCPPDAGAAAAAASGRREVVPVFYFVRSTLWYPVDVTCLLRQVTLLQPVCVCVRERERERERERALQERESSRAPAPALSLKKCN